MGTLRQTAHPTNRTARARAARRLGGLARSACALLALFSLAILNFVIEPHLHAPAGDSPAAVLHAAAQGASADRTQAELQAPDDQSQPACPICTAQNSGAALDFASASAPTAPTPRSVAVAIPPAGDPDSLYAGRSWRSRAPPLHA